MPQLTRKLNVTDKHGFYHSVEVCHDPHLGISIAYYHGDRIADREYGKCCYPPVGDDDSEWEEYHQRLNELADEMETDIYRLCVEYFNSTYQKP